MRIIFLLNDKIIHETTNLMQSPEIDDTVKISNNKYKVTGKTYENAMNTIIVHVLPM